VDLDERLVEVSYRRIEEVRFRSLDDSVVEGPSPTATTESSRYERGGYDLGPWTTRLDPFDPSTTPSSRPKSYRDDGVIAVSESGI